MHLADAHFCKGNYACHVCNKTYLDLYEFADHLRMHENTKQFKCTVCNKRFVAPSLLKCHANVHKVCRSFKCTLENEGVKCNCSLEWEETLKRHLQIHSRLLYECKFEDCNKKFKARHYMIDHYTLIHKDALKCKRNYIGCTDVFRSRAALIDHEKYYCNFK